MRLYVFDHCPFCVRALLLVGLKSLPVTIDYLLEDDVEAPTKMIGKQMVPILEKETNVFMPESLEIVHYLDGHFDKKILTEPQNPKINVWIDENFRRVNDYVMPRYATMNFPEFATESARQMYIDRHEERVGPFADLLARSAEFKVEIEKALQVLSAEIDIDRILHKEKYSLDDILLFPLLRALTCVKGLVFPDNVLEYTKILSERGKLPLFFDQAS